MRCGVLTRCGILFLYEFRTIDDVAQFSGGRVYPVPRESKGDVAETKQDPQNTSLEFQEYAFNHSGAELIHGRAGKFHASRSPEERVMIVRHSRA